MDTLPTRAKQRLLFRHDPHRIPDLGACHAVRPNKLWLSFPSGQIDLAMAISKHVNMGGGMIVRENHIAEAISPEHRDHAGRYPVVFGFSSHLLVHRAPCATDHWLRAKLQ
jgi:hypothetical protein